MEDRADALNRPRSRTGRASIGFLMAILAIATLEGAWFAWILNEPLPNAANIGGKVRRSFLLWRALPEVVPGLSWSDSHLGAAVRQLSHPENLPQRLPIVLAAALIAASAVALGQLVLRALHQDDLRRRLSGLALSYGLGTTTLGVLTLLAGRVGLLSPWSVRLGLMIPIGIDLYCRFHRDRRSTPERPANTDNAYAGVGFFLITGPFLILMALAAMLPTIDFDALEYHLQAPGEFFEAGRITFLPHNVYASMPFGIEMLHLLGMHVLDDRWYGALVGQLMVMLFAPAAAAILGSVAADWVSKRAGWVTAVVYLTTPWIYRLAAIPYVEGPLCYYHAALIAVAGRAWLAGRADGFKAGNAKTWGVVAILAGGAMGCKYPALISAVIPFGLLATAAAIRQRSARIVLAYALGVTVAIGPWLAKNVVDTGNPVYPLAWSIFGGASWDAQREAKWSAAHGPRPVSLEALGAGLMDIAGRSDWQSPLYMALVPLALLRRGSRRLTLSLAGYSLYLFATWFLLTHRLDRFWLPILPGLALMAGIGADWTRRRIWKILLAVILSLGIAVNFLYVTTALAGLNQWTDSLVALRLEVPRMLNPPLARMDEELPPDAKILLVGQASVFHIRHRIAYNTVFDREIIETLARDRSPEQIREALAARGITHVYVDWSEIERHRKPGGYGFTDFVTRPLLAGMVAAGILDPPVSFGLMQDLYRVR